MATVIVKDLIVGEGDRFADVVIQLDAAATQAVTVNYATQDSTADRFGDYLSASGTLTFAAGETSKTVRIDLRDNTTAEGFESFFVQLSAATNATIARPFGMINIIDNDTVVATPRLFVRDVVVDEKQGTATFAVTLGNVLGQASNSTVSVNYATADGTALAGSDYAAKSGTLTFAPGEVVKTVTVNLTDDTAAEGLERFSLVLSSASGAEIADGTGIAEIGANDGTATSQPRISVADAVVGEGDGFVDFVVSLSAPGQNTITVAYSTLDSTADRFGDYVSSATTLTFAPGETTKVVRVELRDGTAAEGFESFYLQLSAATNAVIAKPFAMVNVIDNDTLVDTPQIFARDVVVDEKEGTAVFVVTLGDVLGRASGSTVTVDYALSSGTAAAGSDFTAHSGRLSFAPGEVVKTVVVDITDDTTAEGLERFNLLLSNPVNATIGDGTAIAEIGANDGTATAQPRISVADAMVGEGDGYLDFVVSLSAPGQNTVTVNYTTLDSTADRFGDYVSTATTLSFAPGETTKTVRVELRDGNTAEGFESFYLQLSAATNATIARPFAMVNVVDNDTVVDTPQIFVRDVVVDEKEGVAAFEVTLGNLAGRSSNSTVTVEYATSDGTATAGSDFTAAAGTLRFAPGEVVKTVIVDISDDAAAEGRERFGLQLRNPVNATLGDGFAFGEIAANDATAAAQPRITVGDAVVGEGDSYVDLVVSLSAPGQNTITVNYSTLDSTADRFGDYVSTATTLTFAPGETAKVVRVELRDGNTAEDFESFYLQLSAATNAVIAKPFAMINVVDNDSVVDTPQLFVRDLVVDEKQGTATFAVTLGNGNGRSSNSTVTVDFATGDLTAAAGSDYVARSGSLSFAPGEVVKTVVVDLVDDAATEGYERFSLTLSNPVNATIGDGSALAEIAANDATAVAQPRISVADVAVGESDRYADMVVTLSAPAQNTVTVEYTTLDSTADRFGDYVSTSTALSFAPGETAKVVRVELRDGNVAESLESLYLQLSSATNAVIARPFGMISVNDNDTVVDTPDIFVRDVIVDERQGTANFVVVLGKPQGQSSNSRVFVDFGTVDGTAVAGQDFLARSGTLIFEAGESAKTIVVDLIDDNLREGAERFGLVLGNAVGARLADRTATALVGASDQNAVAQPTVSIESRAVSEGEGYVDLGVFLSAPSQQTVTVTYATRDGTADRFGDYVSTSTTLSFAPGETQKAVRVELRESTTVEGSEAFTVVLSAPTNAAIGSGTGTVTIADNDATGIVVLSHGDGDDVYALTDPSNVVVENPGGGLDTLVAGFSLTLPDNIENGVLTGTAPLTITGNAAANVLRGNAGNNTLNGGAGTDTAVFSGPFGAYAIGGNVAQRTVAGGSDGSDTLLSVERLQFSDQLVAYDTTPGGNTYATYAVLHAILDAPPPPQLLGQWTRQLDLLGNTRDLAQAILNLYVPGIPNELLISYIWGTIVEVPIQPDQLAAVVGLFNNGSFTPASFIEFVATLSLNTDEFASIVGQPVAMDASFFPLPG